MSRFGLNLTAACAVALMLSSCALQGGGSVTAPTHTSVMPSQPDLSSGHITTFPVGSPGLNPRTVAFGSDGNIWFAQDAPYIGRMTPSGSITEIAIPSGNHANDITVGRAGTIWFSEFRVAKIGRISADGTVKEFGGPKKFTFPSGVTLGSDGNIWFIDQRGFIGRMTSRGVVTEFGGLETIPDDITAGPGGNVWFSEGPDVGVITPAGQITNLPNPWGIDTNFTGIAAGPDGNIYVGARDTMLAKVFIAQVTPAGAFTRFVSPLRIFELAPGPDKGIWLSGVTGRFICGSQCVPSLSRFNPATHAFSKPVPLPGANAEAQDLTRGAGAEWFASGTGGYIGEYVP
jgi:virginiamycin B lyase